MSRAARPRGLIRCGRILAISAAALGIAAVALWLVFIYGVIGYWAGLSQAR